MELLLDEAINGLYKSVNILSVHFPKARMETRYRLFKQIGMSVYGSQLWYFEKPLYEKFYMAWRNNIRRIFDLPYQAHSALLHLIVNI